MTRIPRKPPDRRSQAEIDAEAELRRAEFEKDAREVLVIMRKREEDERFDFAYDPQTSMLRYRVRIDQGNDTDWEQAYAAAQRIAERRGAQVQNVRWGKDFWMTELTEVVSPPPIS